MKGIYKYTDLMTGDVCTQGFMWCYRYYDEMGKRKSIMSVDIEKLEQKVKSKGLVWRRLENGGCSTKSLKK